MRFALAVTAAIASVMMNACGELGSALPAGPTDVMQARASQAAFISKRRAFAAAERALRCGSAYCIPGAVELHARRPRPFWGLVVYVKPSRLDPDECKWAVDVDAVSGAVFSKRREYCSG
jgi:hypothetical protein